MTTKLYKINSQWVTEQKAHDNYGFTSYPTDVQTYKSAMEADFGQAVSYDGLFDGDQADMRVGKFFVNFNVPAYNQWFPDLDSLSINGGYFPTQAETITVYSTTQTGVSCLAAKLLSGGQYFYLVQNAVEDEGWMTEQSMERAGWSTTSPIAQLPSVYSFSYSGQQYGWIDCASDGSKTKFYAYTAGLVYTGTGTTNPHVTLSYDTTKKYALLQWQENAGTLTGRTEFEVVNIGGYIGLHNKTEKLYKITQARPFVCDSNQAEVVEVIDGNNNKFNAFKFNDGTKDNYYVLDGTNNSWTDNLGSLGYSLVPEYEEQQLYMQYTSGQMALQSNATSATTIIDGNSTYKNAVFPLYTDSGLTTSFDVTQGLVYERGHYVGDVWTPYPIQSIMDQANVIDNNNPSDAYTLTGWGLLWGASNTTTTRYLDFSSTLFRSCRDKRTWTKQDLYFNAGNFTVQGLTCFYNPSTYDSRYQTALYTDSDRTIEFKRDLDKDYLVLNSITSLTDAPIGEIAPIQSVWDFPWVKTSSTGLDIQTIIQMNGHVRFARNYYVDTSLTFSDPSTISVIWAYKQYVEPAITLDLGLASNGSFDDVAFSADDYWFAFLRNEYDAQKASDFGLMVCDHSSGKKKLNRYNLGFNYELLALCDNLEDPVTTDMSNFYVDATGGSDASTSMVIRSIQAYSTRTVYWRVRITKQPVDLIFFFTGYGAAVTFAANNYEAAFMPLNRDPDVKWQVINLGMNCTEANNGTTSGYVLFKEHYKYELVALYTDTAATQEAQVDLSNFYVDCVTNSVTHEDQLVLKSINAVQTQVVAWKCRITRSGV